MGDHFSFICQQVLYFTLPLYTERYVQWCGRSAAQLMGSLLPDLCQRICRFKRISVVFKEASPPDFPAYGQTACKTVYLTYQAKLGRFLI